MTRTEYPCPSCGELAECGDLRDGSRPRCKACGRRPVFRHKSPAIDPECWPECFQRDHWQLGGLS